MSIIASNKMFLQIKFMNKTIHIFWKPQVFLSMFLIQGMRCRKGFQISEGKYIFILILSHVGLETRLLKTVGTSLLRVSGWWKNLPPASCRTQFILNSGNNFIQKNRDEKAMLSQNAFSKMQCFLKMLSSSHKSVLPTSF